jgi:hypothetical protein
MDIRLRSVFAATALAATAVAGIAGSAQASVNRWTYLAGEGANSGNCITATSNGVYMERCARTPNQDWHQVGSNTNGAPYPTVTMTNAAWGSGYCLTAISPHTLAMVYGGGLCNNTTQAFAMTGPTGQGNYQFFNFTYRACIDSGQAGLLLPANGCNTNNTYQLFYAS